MQSLWQYGIGQYISYDGKVKTMTDVLIIDQEELKDLVTISKNLRDDDQVKIELFRDQGGQLHANIIQKLFKGLGKILMTVDTSPRVKTSVKKD